jgi:hypothetical protein
MGAFSDTGVCAGYGQRGISEDKESNWLPAPESKFILMLRFYWPKESLINGVWVIPPVKQVQ